jgi:putative oxidoreductase
MHPVRMVARPLMASIFIVSGVDTYRNPEPKARLAGPVIDQLMKFAPAGLSDPAALVRANAALQVAAGGMLSLGVLPRLAALALAGSLVPTTLGGHRFWEIEDPGLRKQQRTHFLKNTAILGGLLLAATE